MEKIFGQLHKYRENNRIEAKKATGGLPRSIWETYSAFANTGGGVILLGVAEDQDKRLYPVDLPDAHRLVAQFLELVNNPRVVNINLLSKKGILVEEIDGKEIVVIRVPRATRKQKPVYIGGNPLTGTYYRSGDGDYRCTEEQVRAMQEAAKRD